MPRKDKTSYNEYMKEYRRQRKRDYQTELANKISTLQPEDKPQKQTISIYGSLNQLLEYILKQLKESFLVARRFFHLF